MPYITKDQVKAKRDALKKALPNYKLSITTEHYSGIKVAIMRGPSMLHGSTYEQLNPYIDYREDRWKGDDRVSYPEIADLMDIIMPILNEGKGASTEDGDYGMIPDYYTWVHIGKWDKPYVCTQIAGVDFSESLTQLDNLTILV
tara:strand:- start:1768 stop:2199 length:432 start_codon:yes stop_codon:yes gene_type:complete